MQRVTGQAPHSLEEKKAQNQGSAGLGAGVAAEAIQAPLGAINGAGAGPGTAYQPLARTGQKRGRDDETDKDVENYITYLNTAHLDRPYSKAILTIFDSQGWLNSNATLTLFGNRVVTKMHELLLNLAFSTIRSAFDRTIDNEFTNHIKYLIENFTKIRLARHYQAAATLIGQHKETLAKAHVISNQYKFFSTTQGNLQLRRAEAVLERFQNPNVSLEEETHYSRLQNHVKETLTNQTEMCISHFLVVSLQYLSLLYLDRSDYFTLVSGESTSPLSPLDEKFANSSFLTKDAFVTLIQNSKYKPLLANGCRNQAELNLLCQKLYYLMAKDKPSCSLLDWCYLINWLGDPEMDGYTIPNLSQAINQIYTHVTQPHIASAYGAFNPHFEFYLPLGDLTWENENQIMYFNRQLAFRDVLLVPCEPCSQLINPVLYMNQCELLENQTQLENGILYLNIDRENQLCYAFVDSTPTIITATLSQQNLICICEKFKVEATPQALLQAVMTHFKGSEMVSRNQVREELLKAVCQIHRLLPDSIMLLNHLYRFQLPTSLTTRCASAVVVDRNIDPKLDLTSAALAGAGLELKREDKLSFAGSLAHSHSLFASLSATETPSAGPGFRALPSFELGSTQHGVGAGAGAGAGAGSGAGQAQIPPGLGLQPNLDEDDASKEVPARPTKRAKR